MVGYTTFLAIVEFFLSPPIEGPKELPLSLTLPLRSLSTVHLKMIDGRWR